MRGPLPTRCQRCSGTRLARILAHCSDMCSVDLAGRHLHGYVPRDLGTGGGDFSDGQKGLLVELGEFLKTLEATPMTRSFKMLTLQAMLNRKALPGAVGIKELAAEFQRLASGSAILLADVGEDVNDADKLCRYLEKNPVAAWAGGKGDGRQAVLRLLPGRLLLHVLRGGGTAARVPRTGEGDHRVASGGPPASGPE